MGKCIPVFRPIRPKYHTLWGGTYLYGLYNWLPLPPPPPPHSWRNTVPATGNDERHKLQYSHILSVLMPHWDIQQSNVQKISWNQKKQSDWINMTCGYNDICNSTNHSEVLNIIFFTYTCSFIWTSQIKVIFGWQLIVSLGERKFTF